MLGKKKGQGSGTRGTQNLPRGDSRRGLPRTAIVGSLCSHVLQSPARHDAAHQPDLQVPAKRKPFLCHGACSAIAVVATLGLPCACPLVVFPINWAPSLRTRPCRLAAHAARAGLRETVCVPEYFTCYRNPGYKCGCTSRQACGWRGGLWVVAAALLCAHLLQAPSHPPACPFSFLPGI